MHDFDSDLHEWCPVTISPITSWHPNSILATATLLFVHWIGLIRKSL